MSQLQNTGRAALVAPLTVPVAALTWIIGAGEEVSGLNGFALFWIAVVSYAAFFAIGYPLARLLDTKDYLSIGTLLVAGFVCGVIVEVLLGLGFGIFLGSFKAPTINVIFAFGGLGALVAFVFGLLARVRWSRDPLQDQ